MTRAELIARLADKYGHLSADEVDAAVRSVIDRLSLSLQNGGRIEIRGFGGFSLRHRLPRVGRNPKTGEAVALPAMFAIHFKPGKELRERVNALATEKPSLPLMPDC
jgi:integration host factor subunit beta